MIQFNLNIAVSMTLTHFAFQKNYKFLELTVLAVVLSPSLIVESSRRLSNESSVNLFLDFFPYIFNCVIDFDGIFASVKCF